MTLLIEKEQEESAFLKSRFGQSDPVDTSPRLTCDRYGHLVQQARKNLEKTKADLIRQVENQAGSN